MTLDARAQLIDVGLDTQTLWLFTNLRDPVCRADCDHRQISFGGNSVNDPVIEHWLLDSSAFISTGAD